MSLRKFHIFFITVSGLLALLMVFWGVWYFQVSGQWVGFLYSALGIASGLGLMRYLKWFSQKYASLLGMVVALSLGLCSLLYSQNLWACAVCYSDPDSNTTKAALLGVAFLGIVVYAVLFGMINVARSWQRRARDLNRDL